jgi:hypothetical protein
MAYKCVKFLRSTWGSKALIFSQCFTLPLPHRTRVPMNAMFFLDVCPFVFNTGAVIFAAGSVSPVKLLSSIAKSIAYEQTSTCANSSCASPCMGELTACIQVSDFQCPCVSAIHNTVHVSTVFRLSHTMCSVLCYSSQWQFEHLPWN